MDLLTVPYLVAALLLLVAGAAKAWSPESTVGALRDAGLPASSLLVRTFSGAEVVVGAAALLVDGWLPAVAVAVSYVGFAGFLVRSLVLGDVASCGCFAGDSAEPTPVHVLLDLGFAAAAGAVALGSASTSLPSAWEAGVLPGTVALVLVASLLSYVVLAHLPSRGEVPERLLLEEPV